MTRLDIFAGLVVLLAISTPPIQAQEHDVPLLIEQADRATVALVERCRTFVAGVQQGNRYGSGILVEPGLLLTGTGIVSQPGSVVIWLADERRLQGEVVAIDRALNATLVRYDSNATPTVAIEWNEQPRVGQMVVALGNPFGTMVQTQQLAASLGTLSDRYRVRGDRFYAGEVFETTAAINDGSFGGPLVDLRGRVLAMVHRSVSYHRWFGVAIPAMPLKEFIARYKAGTTQIENVPAEAVTQRGSGVYLGVQVRQARINLRTPRGMRPMPAVQVAAVAPGSPAERAGILAGDLLLMVDRQGLANPAALAAQLGSHEPGDEVEVVFLRQAEGKTQQYVRKLRLGSLPM